MGTRSYEAHREIIRRMAEDLESERARYARELEAAQNELKSAESALPRSQRGLWAGTCTKAEVEEARARIQAAREALEDLTVVPGVLQKMENVLAKGRHSRAVHEVESAMRLLEDSEQKAAALLDRYGEDRVNWVRGMADLIDAEIPSDKARVELKLQQAEEAAQEAGF